MKTIKEIFNRFYDAHLKSVDTDDLLKDKINEGNYQFVLGFASGMGIRLSKEVIDADLFLHFRLLSPQQIDSAGKELFRADYEKIAGKGVLQ